MENRARDVEAVIFDLDDTLLDRASTVAAYLEGQRRRLGAIDPALPEADYLRCFIQLDELSIDDRHAIFASLHPLPAPVDDLAEDFREHAWSNSLPFPDAMESLVMLRACGYRLGVITNGPDEIQSRKIVSLGLPSLVDTILVSGREGARKPDPAIFHLAASRLGVSVSRCLFVGDNPEADVAGAHAAGMSSAWRRGFFTWPEGVVDPPMYVIDGLAELVGVLVAGGGKEPKKMNETPRLQDTKFKTPRGRGIRGRR